MGTVDEPDLTIEYYNGSQWVDLTQYARSFSISDAGILKIPLATVTLHTIPTLPSANQLLRIFVNTTGTNYMPFYGRISPRDKLPIKGTTSKFTYAITAYGLERRLARDTITWEYAKEQASRSPETLWTFKSMIEDFLKIPDSGYDTGFTFDTDTSEILNNVYGDCDFDKTYLQDALRIVAETIGYDGYVWLDGSTAKLLFKKLGTVPTNPATTFSDPFVGSPKRTWTPDDVVNYVLAWGGVDAGHPSDEDKFTERVQAKYGANSPWSALDQETLADSNYDSGTSTGGNTSSTLKDTGKSWTSDTWKSFQVYIHEGKGEGQLRNISGNGSTQLTITPNWDVTPDDTSKYMIIKGDNFGEYTTFSALSRYSLKSTTDVTKSWHKLRFDLTKTGISNADMKTRFQSIVFSLHYPAQLSQFSVWRQFYLQDSSGNRAIYIEAPDPLINQYRNFGLYDQIRVEIPTPLNYLLESYNEHRYDRWQYADGYSSFAPAAVTLIDLWVHKASSSETNSVFLDRFMLHGGLKIDPFQNPQYYPKYATQQDPASFDQTSIDTYGISVYHHINQNLKSFQQAQDEADRVLAVLKDQLEIITVTKKGYEWTRPTQTATVDSSTLGISSSTWRILDIERDWIQGHPVYSTFRLVPQYAKTPPVFGPSGEVPAPKTTPIPWEWWNLKMSPPYSPPPV